MRLKNIHKGERCFVIGTGPSLNLTNFNLLKGEIIFGVNTLYRGMLDFGIACKYYGVSDGKVWSKHWKSVLGLDTTLFLSSNAGKYYSKRKRFFSQFEKRKPTVFSYLGQMTSPIHFSKNPFRGLYNGWTVIIDVCLQMAYYMGFKTVYLLGCDCDYSGMHRWDGLRTENVIQTKWESVFNAYEICKRTYEKDGRKIINSTVGGKLEVFKRERLEWVI